MSRSRNSGFVSQYSRSDLNLFNVLSDNTQDCGSESSGDCADLFSDGQNVEPEFQTVERRRYKRRCQNTEEKTPGKENHVNVDENIDYESLGSEEKLTLILTKVSLNENRFRRIEGKLDIAVRNQKRLTSIEKVIRSYEDRIKLLEYKSIDIEARGRRNNLLFYGFDEQRNEDCRDKIARFVCDKFNIPVESVVIERAHRVGKFNIGKASPRPIIAAFMDYTTTENIMSQGRILKGTQHSVSRDYPLEITNARKLLWDELKTIKS